MSIHNLNQEGGSFTEALMTNWFVHDENTSQTKIHLSRNYPYLSHQIMKYEDKRL
jgi:hypothetical protein